MTFSHLKIYTNPVRAAVNAKNSPKKWRHAPAANAEHALVPTPLLSLFCIPKMLHPQLSAECIVVIRVLRALLSSTTGINIYTQNFFNNFFKNLFYSSSQYTFNE